MISRRLILAVLGLVAAVLALGLYTLHLARTAQRVTPAAVERHPIAPPVAGPLTPVVLFLANDDDGTLRKQESAIAMPPDPAKRGREILRALVEQYQEPDSTHSLGAGADITDVYLVNGLAIVDANAAFATGHRSGILVEELTLASMAETLSANIPGITHLKLLIQGQERATLAGHADLSEPYDVSSAAELVR